MNIVKLSEFELAIYTQGDPSSTKLALVLPGRLDTKDYPHMKSHVDFLASLGYQAVSFDPPGTWESPGSIDIYTMTSYLKAIDELIEHFGNKPTLVLGHSRGGSMAMLAAIKNPSIIGFISVMSRATTSIPSKSTLSKDSEVSYRDLPEDPQKKKRFDLPLAYFKDAAQYNMLEGLKQCEKPKLFIYGTQDTTVTPGYVIEAYEASAEPKQIVEIDSIHDYRWKPETINQVNGIVKDWLSTR